MKKIGVVQALRKASQGLLFPSKRDAPFEAFEWPGEEGTPDTYRVLQMAGLPDGTPVRVKSLDAFFQHVTRDQDWHNLLFGAEEKAEAERFRQLVRALEENLFGVKVFELGRSEKAVYIVGRSHPGWAGLKTKVVET